MCTLPDVLRHSGRILSQASLSASCIIPVVANQTYALYVFADNDDWTAGMADVWTSLAIKFFPDSEPAQHP